MLLSAIQIRKVFHEKQEMEFTFFPFCGFQSLIYFLFLIENWSQGGDPVIFKKLNDAYYKLIGHIQKVQFSENIARHVLK